MINQLYQAIEKEDWRQVLKIAEDIWDSKKEEVLEKERQQERQYTADWASSLPEGTVIERGLDLSCWIPITSLPKNLTVKGDLDISNTPLEQLPEGLVIEGSLYVESGHLKTLPEDIKISGSLYLAGCPISCLPKNLKLGGYLRLGGCPIGLLPEGLEIGEFLDIEGTQISSLPSDLKVPEIYSSTEIANFMQCESLEELRIKEGKNWYKKKGEWRNYR